MQRLPLRLVFAAFVICLCCSATLARPHVRRCGGACRLAICPCSAASPAAAISPVESVLAKWEAASQKCRTLDAKLTVFRYDLFNGDRAEFPRPVLFRAAEHRAVRNPQGGNGKVNDWPALSEVLIWNGKDLLWIDGRADVRKGLLGEFANHAGHV